jgi:ubiquinone/menaquinone biosynthesis C-methylase UbiE
VVAEQVLLNFKLGSDAYAMAVEVTRCSAGCIVVTKPQVIYRAERRDRQRECLDQRRRSGDRVRLAYGEHTLGYGRLNDISPDGLGVDVPAEVSLSGRESIVVHFLEGEQQGRVTTAELRHERNREGSGWKRIGLSRLRDGKGLLSVDRRTRLYDSHWSSVQTRWSMLGAGLRMAGRRALPTILPASSQSAPVRIVDYKNAAGERLRAIVDCCGDTRAAPAIIIPPAWGRTKETLLPLAATIISSFRASGRSVVVVRFDGIRRRGESFNDSSCKTPGSEYHRFTFSQAVDDILATADFLNSDPEFQPRSLVVVTFSAASIDGRRAVAAGADRGLSGWISVVGSADLQSMMRVVSGGVDFVSGVERGIRFGLNTILGVEVDIDLAGRDAIESRLAFLEDSCRDFETIHVPVTWFHGRYDAWMDLERIRVALSSGDRSERKLIEVPTGHQLRSSKEALALFQLVAAEAGRMIGYKSMKPCLPDLDEMDRRRRAEKARLPLKGRTDRRAFWKSYLLGRDGSIGIELMTGTSAYHAFMGKQIDLLQLTRGERVLDLAAGTGSFPLQVAEGVAGAGLRIVGVDYVKESLRRAQMRLANRFRSGLNTEFAVCDLDVGARYSIPMSDQSFDAALASLLMGYLDSPLEFFKEVARVLRPGGRFVTSGLRKDADVSRIFRAGLAELESGIARPHFDPREIRDLPTASRDFLSEAARLFDLEEEGVFEFRDPDEVMSMLREAGFGGVSLTAAFGDPPQAIIVSAYKGQG